MSSADIHVTTLGQLRIARNGQTLADFVSSKAALLFVYLAMQPGEHTRKKLAAMFWSETPDEQALKNLRTVLTSLRQNLPDAMLIERESLAINPDLTVHVDAAAFEAACIALLSAPSVPEMLEQQLALAAMYQGAFLAEVSFREAEALEEWITVKQRQLQQLYTRLLCELIETATHRFDYDIALQYAQRLTSIDPYWDIACRQWMRLLAYTQRANEALLHYEAFARLLASELNAVPEDETTRLYEQIRARQLQPPQSELRHSTIVLPDMPFIEAVDDMALVQRMLNTPQCHLLTIYGISGVGKTTLATQVAFQRQHSYRDGAYVVGLKRAQTARDLPFLLAVTLKIEYSNQTSAHDLETIVLDWLKARHLLLVLDSYEHLLPETSFVQRMLETATQLQVIITSQASLSLFREWLFPLQGLRVPMPDDTQPENSEAVRLFEVTAQRMNPRFELSRHLREVVEICQLVDGLPLALIIAASWTQIIPISKIKELIADGHEFNLPLHQDLPPHHQSIDMMLEYTWTALSEQEQYALTALSIFHSAFDLQEVEHICEIDFMLITTMVQRALIQKFGDKYRMHQLVWRYARKKLLFSHKKALLSQRYSAYRLRQLDVIQQNKPPLHEYLLEIELHYGSLLNFDWMSKSLQSVYLLALSRFLMPYWEISRKDELPQLQKRFEGIQTQELDADMQLLLQLQLARFHERQERLGEAQRNIAAIFASGATHGSWADWAALFCLCMSVLPHTAPDGNAEDERDLDTLILNASYHKLLALYLDMRDYEGAEIFLPHLMDNMHRPVDRAVVAATYAAIAAETGRMALAFEWCNTALVYLGDDDGISLMGVLKTLQLRTGQAQ
ncbi:MAG: BTAD domain-containing putative transcriptional regulator [Chloroflexota bacterium]|nr:BTAD domain-containing putative transcriptional regulator [Chloroflexota bacterium]